MTAINPDNRASNLWGLEVLDPKTLKIPKRDVRKHPRAQIDAIKVSFQQLDQLKPVIIDTGDEIIDGVAVVLAAIELGVMVTALRLNHLSRKQIREARIVLNKLGERGGWSIPELKIEVEELFHIGSPAIVAAFEPPELDILIGNAAEDEEGHAPTQPIKDPITREGDLCTIGRHAVICGSSLDANVVDRLVQDRPIGAAILDPPYNKRVSEISGKGRHKHREFAMASGEQTDQEFATFNVRYLEQLYRVLAPGRLAFVFMDWRGIHILVAAGERVGFTLKNICCWVKSNAGMGSLYRSQHELVAVFQKPGPGVNNVQLGRFVIRPL